MASRNVSLTEIEEKIMGKVKEPCSLLRRLLNGKNEIEKAFRGSKNEVFNTSEFIIYYTYTKGHQKDERLIVIEEK